MSGFVAIVLLFVAAALLVLGAVMASRASEREPSPWTRRAMAAMLGLAIGFLLLVVSVSPLGLFPLALSALLIADWARRRRGSELGAFLMGGGAMWAWSEISVVINDLSDPAVSYPGWTPVPLAMAFVALLFGGYLVARDLLRHGPSAGHN